MIHFGSGLIASGKTWAELKAVVSDRNLSLQYDENSASYSVFAVDGALVFHTIIFKGTVPAVCDMTQEENDLAKADFEGDYKVRANRPANREDVDKVRMAGANFRKTGIADTAYFMLVDFDNADGYGPYKHLPNTCIDIAGVHGTFRKSVITDDWGCYIGCVLAIDGSQATIGWLRFGTAGLRDTANIQNIETTFTFPLLMCLKVADGDYAHVLTNFKETTGAVNTGTTLEDASGAMRIPAVGDLLMKVEKFSGSGTVTFHYFVWYCTE